MITTTAILAYCIICMVGWVLYVRFKVPRYMRFSFYFLTIIAPIVVPIALVLQLISYLIKYGTR